MGMNYMSKYKKALTSNLKRYRDIVGYTLQGKRNPGFETLEEIYATLNVPMRLLVEAPVALAEPNAVHK